MLEKIKDLGAQVANKANDAVDGLTSSVKGGVESLADAINEKAVRSSTAQMCKILEIALEELKDKPLEQRPLVLTASVNFGIATLQMQVNLEPPKEKADQPLLP